MNKAFVDGYLNKSGYTVNTYALGIIDKCDDWYSNRLIKDFHKRTNLNGITMQLNNLNMAKRCCADDANLCEIISVVPEQETASEQFIADFLTKNKFDTQYREQLEKTSALGTVGAYIYLNNADYMQDSKGAMSVRGGDIRINYVDASTIIPLTVVNGEIIECAFAGTDLINGAEQTTLVIFTMTDDKYKADTVVFDKDGKILQDKLSTIQLGEVKPFAIMRNAEVNNIDDMIGYGLPKIYNSIPYLKAVDLCYNILYGDLDKGDKLVFLNELLACVQTDESGRPYLTPQQKKLFILLGEDGGGKLPEENTLVQEYNPEIRIQQITQAFELVLSMLSMSFGYGTKKYSFENGRITTATEYIGTKQDSMQELNKQRKQAEQYINDLVHAAMWFSNTFDGTSFNVEEVLKVEFDDSFIVDRESALQRKRDDASLFQIPQLLIWYIMDAYNVSEEEATAMVNGVEQEPTEPIE